MIKKIAILVLLLFSLSLPTGVWAQEEKLMEGEVIKIFSQEETDAGWRQSLGILIKKGDEEGKSVKVVSGQTQLDKRQFSVGDKVILAASEDLEGNKIYYIDDYIRRPVLGILAGIFLFLVLLIGGWRGTKSLLGLVVSFGVILFLVLPWLNQGKNPVLVSFLASVLMMPPLFYFSHGFSAKTSAAVLGTVIALLIILFLASGFIRMARLTGLSSEEAGFLQTSHATKFNFQGLILAGIIIGALGVLDDITVSQASIVEKLRQNTEFEDSKLFWESLTVGRDHIASMVNTLILAYVGASLPLLLLFIDNPKPLSLVMNYEIIAEEIIRSLIGSIGLIMAVPITTFLAVKMIKK